MDENGQAVESVSVHVKQGSHAMFLYVPSRREHGSLCDEPLSQPQGS